MALKPFIIISLAASLIFSSINAVAFQIELKRDRINHQLPKLSGESKIDGIIDEAIWQQALEIELVYETAPAENETPPVKTLAYLYEDGKAIYIAFKAFDPRPDLIRNYLSDRDNVWESDLVGIKFDTFGESRKAFQFFVNPSGIQADATQEDFRPDDINWDVIWQSAGRITEEGYQVEMRIPYSALRFPEKQGAQTWPFEILRFYPRDYRHRIANTPVDRDISCNICQFDNLVGIADVKPSHNTIIAPTMVLARADTRGLPPEDWQTGDLDSEFGLDLRWGITQDTVLNATLNPDFSQVEADDAQIDVNNPFTLFLDEKRPFFLDGTDYFNGMQSLVYTRNVVQPDYGLKVTGQSNGHSYGLISVDDQFTNILLPGPLRSNLVQLENSESNNRVARYSYDLGNKNNLGFFSTQRSADDYKNQVFAIDGKYWFDQYHSISAQLISTDTDNPQQLVDQYGLSRHQSGDAFTLNFQHNSRNWWGYFDYIEFDPGFRADLGFISQVGYDKKIAGLGHRWYPEDDSSWWSQLEFGGDIDETYDSDGRKLEQEVEASAWLQGAMRSNINVGVISREKLWQSIDNPADFAYFDERFYFLNGNFQPTSGLTLTLNNRWGDFIDYQNGELGQQVTVSPQVDWQISQGWLASLDFERTEFDNSSGRLFTAEVTNLRATYQMTIRSFLRLTLQEFELKTEQTEKNRSLQLLYSYKVNPRTLFFAGYSDAGFQDANLTSLRKSSRSVFMKFSYAWQY